MLMQIIPGASPRQQHGPSPDVAPAVMEPIYEQCDASDCDERARVTKYQRCTTGREIGGASCGWAGVRRTAGSEFGFAAPWEIPVMQAKQ
mmetsp:Transcript_148785/g.477878  ORF Transcript_148785/g.477878 Transcript_148785/m.477878 type:complete len:90 (-) Transcript_148785:1693-1962(-)